jgi:hypothetical protein
MVLLFDSHIIVDFLQCMHCCRLEEATGLAFRFIIGKSNSKNKMAALEKEVEEYDDFVLLDILEEYSRLPYKTYRIYPFPYCYVLSFPGH